MSVQAKVRCIANGPSAWDPQGTSGRMVRFSCVYDTDPNHPNFKWSQATPSGYFEMYVTNPAAFDAFVVNEEYLVTLEPVKQSEPAATTVPPEDAPDGDEDSVDESAAPAEDTPDQ